MERSAGRLRPAAGTQGWLAWVVGVAALAGLAAVPRLGLFAAYLGTEILIAVLFAQAFHLLFGYTGLLSFGQAAFFGIGAYGVAVLLRDVTHSMAVAMAGAVALAALCALVIGFLSVRRDEIFFSMLTLAFGMMVYTVAFQWRSFTGGSDGLTRFEVPQLNLLVARVDLGDIEQYYYFTLVVVLLGVGFLWRLVQSPFGQVLVGLRENPQRMAFVGVHVARYRLAAFVVAGALSGVAGALMSPFAHIASPVYVHWTKSAEPVLMTLLGGSRVFLGPAVGAALFLYLHNLVTQYTDHWEVVLGGILLVLILFFPDGILGSLVRAYPRWKAMKGELVAARRPLGARGSAPASLPAAGSASEREGR